MTADEEGGLTERAVLATVLVGAAVAITLLLGILSLVHTGSPEARARRVPPEDRVLAVGQRWVDAWVDGVTKAMHRLASTPARTLDGDLAAFRESLHVAALRVSPRSPVVHGTDATVELDVAVDVTGVGTWVYTGQLALVLPADAATDDGWRVAWSRRDLHPSLTGTRQLKVVRAYAPRAALLAGDGTPLSGPGARPTAGLVQQLVGRVGTAADDAGGRVKGDPVGISGLQAAFDAELGGRPSADVQLVEGDTVVEPLAHLDGAAPQPVRTSVDLHVQDVAESVLSTVTDHPAAIVALRPSTGEVLATASVPQRGFNRALLGRYPPGSTFKVITSTALLEHGTTPDTRTMCPHDVRINGRVFQNAEDEELGDISFATAFAHSCNTAFIQLAEQLQPVDLVTAAQQFGFNAPPAAEVAAQTSSYPEPGGLIDQVSSAIGQGRVLATPLQMASVAATVASGVHRDTTFRHLDAAPAGAPLPAGVAPTLQALMQRVVSEGTAASAHLPSGTAGKTGTAEFGSGNPPQTHAWFIGFRGDLAFAVLVEDGGFGGKVAAPLARDFLRRL
ncbi:MAG: hypothetical protein QOD30_1696 [Actinomycetota bacterium]|nr:hypothetical protein [Actinomycetota bacterium]